MHVCARTRVCERVRVCVCAKHARNSKILYSAIGHTENSI